MGWNKHSNELLYEFNIVTPSGVTMDDVNKFMESDARWRACIKAPYDPDKHIPITQYTGPYIGYEECFMYKPEYIIGFFKEIVDNKLVMYTNKDLWSKNLLHKWFDNGVELCAYLKGMISTIDDNNITTIHRLLSFDIAIKD
jgi:hypothetical protein